MTELPMVRTAYTTCPLCEATCGLALTVSDGRITGVRGDKDDVLSHGFICPKGAALGQLDEDPDRLRAPLVRRDGHLAGATWDEAFTAVAAGLGAVIDRYGRDAVALYLGNPTVHTLAGGLFAGPLRAALGSRNIYTASTVDQMPKHVSCGYLFGHPLAIPVPDVDRTDFLLILGADPYSSNGSLWTAPDLPGRLRALRERGGRLVVVDPRRSRTARAADRHLAIRPGTDVYLLLALAHELFAAGLVAPGRLADHLNGLSELAELVAPATPQAMAPRCGIDAGDIRTLARELAAAPRAAVYGRIGTTTVAAGTVTSWLVDVLNVLTGNLDRAGGAMFPLPAHGHRGRGTGAGFTTGRWHSRVRGLPEVFGELPAVTLVDEIETPGEGQVRALVTVAGNPALSVPGGDRLGAALSTLDFMVSVDPYLNATTRHADVILPPPAPAEQSHYDLSFYHFSVRNVANFSPPVRPLSPGALDEADILLRLIAILAGRGSWQSIVDGRRQAEKLVDDKLRAGPYGLTLDKLRENPHGIDLGPLEERIPENLRTPSGRIELCPEPVASEARRLLAAPTTAAWPAAAEPTAAGPAAAGPAAAEPGLVLIGRRHLRSNNSWMGNVPALAKGASLCTLLVHPSDAARLGLVDGGRADVRSRAGAVEATVEVSDAMAPGVVSLPHGFGHDLPGVRLSVAGRNPGVSVNRVTDELAVDPLSGTAVLNGVPVEVRAVAP
jgi:anaerobic selenocysteine-containing dehydrogenase